MHSTEAKAPEKTRGLDEAVPVGRGCLMPGQGGTYLLRMGRVSEEPTLSVKVFWGCLTNVFASIFLLLTRVMYDKKWRVEKPKALLKKK